MGKVNCVATLLGLLCRRRASILGARFGRTVLLNKELEEEEEVNTIHGNGRSHNQVRLDTGAVTSIGIEVAPISVNGNTNKHLSNLSHSQDLRPPGSTTQSSYCIVVVHKGVDQTVNGQEEPAGRICPESGIPSEKEDSDMVEPVKEIGLASLGYH